MITQQSSHKNIKGATNIPKINSSSSSSDQGSQIESEDEESKELIISEISGAIPSSNNKSAV